MANKEQYDILRHSVSDWNDWRIEYKDAKIDLSNADFTYASLNGANLIEANLEGANLQLTRLREADLKLSNLKKANFRGAFLERADLREADLSEAILTKANLEQALLMGSRLDFAIFSETDLIETDFSGALLVKAIFSFTDLGQAQNLDKITHGGPSTIGEETIAVSRGKIPESFLRGCGLADVQIETAKLFNPDLSNEEIVKIQYRIYDLRATQALQISPLFISYSHADTPFVDTLDSALTEKGVRFWRDIHDATVGRLETQIDRAISLNQTVLLILSKNSLDSDWVQHEVRKARKLEKELGRDVLCPISLDDSWKSSKWPEHIMEQIMEYNILGFSGWEDVLSFESKFSKLLNGLSLFYNKGLKKKRR